MELAPCRYEPLPSLDELERGAPPPLPPLPPLPPHHPHGGGAPDLVGGEEDVEWLALGNLDAFFTRLYRYWLEKGWAVIAASRVLNLAALAFTIVFSAFLLLGVDWGALHAQCLMAHDRGSCDILSVAVHAHPLRGRSPALVALAATHVALCCVYWLWSAASAAVELRGALETRHFVANKLGVSDRQVRMMTWGELLHRVVLVQRHARLCAACDLDEHAIVSRVMRKDNYLIGMLSEGVLALHAPPLLGPPRLLAALGLPRPPRRFVLTKTLEWALYWAILDPMWDEDGVRVRPEWLADEAGLARRLRLLALLNAAVAPFLLVFLATYFAMKNAERFYHSPGTLGARRWSPLARWRLRELNELPHYVHHRLAAGHEAAARYLAQFPSPLLTQVARFVSFIAGSFAALLLGLSLLDENLLEVPLAGRNVVWWLALTGILLAASRAFISDAPPALDPERAMAELVAHTHHLPRHWRGRAHTAEVQGAVAGLFRLKVALFLEELASVVVTPYILGCALPQRAGAILAFVRDHTVHLDGVGDVCSLAAFDFGRHGNAKYGAPGAGAPKGARSRGGKMEKSFLTFAATYPTWVPPPGGRAMLAALTAHAADVTGGGGGYAAAAAARPYGCYDGWRAAGFAGAPVAGWAGPVPIPIPVQSAPKQQQHQQQPSPASPATPFSTAHLSKVVDGSSGGGSGRGGGDPLLASLLGGDDTASPSASGGPGDFGPPAGADAARDQQPQQQQQQQEQWYQPPPLATGAGGGHHPLFPAAAPLHFAAPAHAVLQVWPSTLYPGGPNAAAALPHGGNSAAYGGSSILPGGAWSAFAAPSDAAGATAAAHQQQHQQQHGSDAPPPPPPLQQPPPLPPHVGGSFSSALARTNAGGSDLLPANEAVDLSARLAGSHLLLQSYYEAREPTVQLRNANRLHARSALLQRAFDGGALPSTVPFLQASAAAAAANAGMGRSSHARPPPSHGGHGLQSSLI